MPWFAVILWWIWSIIQVIFKKFTDFTVYLSKQSFEFLKNNWRYIVKILLFFSVIKFTISIISYVIYNIYYWWTYVLSNFITMFSINIISVSFLWIVIFFIYNFLYKD